MQWSNRTGSASLTPRMDRLRVPRPQAKKWSVSQTHALLDLIRDLGLVGLLNRKYFQNWDVFERLHGLLRRCNIHFSPGQIKAHWQRLKLKYLRLKKFAQMGTTSGVLADFPYYEEMEQLLGTALWPCKREADSSGLNSPSELAQSTSGAAVSAQLEAAASSIGAGERLQEEHEGGAAGLPAAQEESEGGVPGPSGEQEPQDPRSPSQSAGAACEHCKQFLLVLRPLQRMIRLSADILEPLRQMWEDTEAQLESLCTEMGGEGAVETVAPCPAVPVDAPIPAAAPPPPPPPPPVDAPQQEVPPSATAARSSPGPMRARRSGNSASAGLRLVPRRSCRQRRPSLRYHYH
ncbi:uncharacterized protein LOC115079447 isoform X2 [Rhinatrema bivittatum]|uniref:uncharacterized protein LOC115079447 isoform X2 n=1 Tax=Rhinatrema bivittatum TaxID=194408 RepID=UPI00112924B7|nr:uncharacterized protein LOC115079447 isoform X2 [Rhinatrema bivittatum]